MGGKLRVQSLWIAKGCDTSTLSIEDAAGLSLSRAALTALLGVAAHLVPTGSTKPLLCGYPLIGTRLFPYAFVHQMWVPSTPIGGLGDSFHATAPTMQHTCTR